jgi:hypothetical protein
VARSYLGVKGGFQSGGIGQPFGLPNGSKEASFFGKKTYFITRNGIKSPERGWISQRRVGPLLRDVLSRGNWTIN